MGTMCFSELEPKEGRIKGRTDANGAVRVRERVNAIERRHDIVRSTVGDFLDCYKCQIRPHVV